MCYSVTTHDDQRYRLILVSFHAAMWRTLCEKWKIKHCPTSIGLLRTAVGNKIPALYYTEYRIKAVKCTIQLIGWTHRKSSEVFRFIPPEGGVFCPRRSVPLSCTSAVLSREMSFCPAKKGQGTVTGKGTRWWTCLHYCRKKLSLKHLLSVDLLRENGKGNPTPQVKSEIARTSIGRPLPQDSEQVGQRRKAG